MLTPLHRIAAPILALPRLAKSLVVLMVDTSLCVLTIWLSFYLRLGEFSSLDGASLYAAITSIVIALPIFVTMGLYRAIFRYSGWPALMTVTKAIVIYGLIFSTIFTFVGIAGVPRTVGLIQPLLLLVLVGASRAIAHFWLGGAYQRHLQSAALPNVLIYGAGAAGRQLAAAMSNSHEMRIVGFLDDDVTLHGHVLNGRKIYNPSNLEDLAKVLNVHTVLLALPSISRSQRNQIIQQMLDVKLSVRTLPSLTELAQGKVNVSDLRELDIDDLLGRDPVAPDTQLLAKNIAGKVVLVTGAGGSIGSELCRQILVTQPAVLLLIEQSEFALYKIHQELDTLLSNQPGNTSEVIPLLASVRDETRIKEILSNWKIDTIYHAAAYKHVPLVEHNPVEGIRNNVIGTLVIAKLAIEHNVVNFVLISTDKAVRPTNVMGATKRLAEMILQALAASGSATNFCMVRFGNVLGSSGSVVPKFRKQIRNGGPITLTDKGITRYFMTIPEAAQLVIQAGAMARGGDVFVLDMGQPVRIIDLARRMVELSGLTLKDENHKDGDIEIQTVGLRPGEKLYEELLIGENPEHTKHPRIMKAHELFLSWDELDNQLNILRIFLDSSDQNSVRALLQNLIDGYSPTGEIVDWTYQK
jgi:FlaA1/EpsC-like NDP-sugar epimerase